MKIKTITCHDVYNVGASLQAYALAEYLKQLGHDVEIIDYKPDYLSGHYRLWGGVNPVYNKPLLRQAYCLAKLPGRLKARYGKRKKAFDAFTNEYLPLTAVRYHSIDELRENPPEADLFIAGSDQIWNTVFLNGKDPSFYLQFAPQNCVRAAYAASFATEHVLPQWETQLQKWLSELDYIAVREQTGLAILEELGVSGGIQVLDPVFLLPKEKWDQLSAPMDFPEPYVLLYEFDRNPQIASAAKKLAQENEWKLYSILPNDACDRCCSDCGPREFLSLIKNAELVLSNSFHATAFSILFEKQFRVFQRQEKINSRMIDLLQLFHLEMFLADKPYMLDLRMQASYDAVNPLISDQINKSKDYLSTVLKGK